MFRLWHFPRTCISVRRVYSTVMRTPPSSAPREVPTPLVFVSASKWDPASHTGITYVSSFLAEKGYTCLHTDLSPPEGGATLKSPELMHYFESKLRDEIRFSALLFPPVVFARSAACLIAQTYISSNPASGLFLMSPPISNASLPKELLPTDLAEFDFEPKFPVGIMGTPKEMEALRVHHRLGDDPNVDKMNVANLDGSEALNEIERWLDDVGI